MSARTLVLATHNAGKLREIEALLAGLPYHITSACALALLEPEETGSTFAENAAIKALAAAHATGQWALADDSGLVIPALGGAPGIYSARWTGPEKSYDRAFARIQQELAACQAPATPPAHFTCMLCLATPQGGTTFFEGQVHGHLTFPPRGPQGFGYDPIFVPEGSTRTFGGTPAAEKNAISHRARALAQLRAHLTREAA